MCKWGTEVITRVLVPADLSHSGEPYWKEVGVDACIAPIVAALQGAGIHMRGSCCGHGRGDGRIDLIDGRYLIVVSQPCKHLMNASKSTQTVNEAETGKPPMTF